MTRLPSRLPKATPIAPLLEQAQAGSSVAIGSLLEAARSYLLLQAEQHLPQSLRAKVGPSDIVQETAIDAHTSRDSAGRPKKNSMPGSARSCKTT